MVVSKYSSLSDVPGFLHYSSSFFKKPFVFQYLPHMTTEICQKTTYSVGKVRGFLVFFFSYLNGVHFLEQFHVPSKIEQKAQRISISPWLPHAQPPQPPIINTSCHSCNWWACTDTLSKSVFPIGDYSWWCTFMGFERCIMSFTHHYGVMQRNFLAIKFLCSTYSVLSPSLTPDNHCWFFSPECYSLESIQYVACAKWLLSVSNIHLSFLHGFSMAWWFTSF